MPSEIPWTPAAQRNLRKLPTKVGHAVIEFLYGPSAEDPQRVGKALRLELAGLHSARRGDFRVIYLVDSGADRIDIVAIEHRSDAYRFPMSTGEASSARIGGFATERAGTRSDLERTLTANRLPRSLDFKFDI